MAKVMSPKAPENETAGMRCAARYYSIAHLSDTPQELIQSAELVCASPLGQRQGAEWRDGFMRMTVEIAARRDMTAAG